MSIELPFHVCHRRYAHMKVETGAWGSVQRRLCRAQWKEKEERFDLEVTARLKITYFKTLGVVGYRFIVRTGTPDGGVRSITIRTIWMHRTIIRWMRLVNWVAVYLYVPPARRVRWRPPEPHWAVWYDHIYIRPEAGEAYGLEINGTFPRLCTDIKVGVREFPRAM